MFQILETKHFYAYIERHNDPTFSSLLDKADFQIIILMLVDAEILIKKFALARKQSYPTSNP